MYDVHVMSVHFLSMQTLYCSYNTMWPSDNIIWNTIKCLLMEQQCITTGYVGGPTRHPTPIQVEDAKASCFTTKQDQFVFRHQLH